MPHDTALRCSDLVIVTWNESVWCGQVGEVTRQAPNPPANREKTWVRFAPGVERPFLRSDGKFYR